jgi:hypothetical protein
MTRDRETLTVALGDAEAKRALAYRGPGSVAIASSKQLHKTGAHSEVTYEET